MFSGGNYAPDFLVITTAFLSTSTEDQTHEALAPALLFLEDAKAIYVGGFFRGEDDSVSPADNCLLCFMRQRAIPNHSQAGTCAGLNGPKPLNKYQTPGVCSVKFLYKYFWIRIHYVPINILGTGYLAVNTREKNGDGKREKKTINW